MRRKFYILFVVIFSIIISSCATRVSFKVTRPAEIDLNGAKTIAVLPIKPYEYININSNTLAVDFFLGAFFGRFDKISYDEKLIIDYLQTSIERGLIDSPYIELISASAVEQAAKKGYINPADVYLTGEITYFKVNDYKRKEKVQVKKDKDDEKQKKEYKYVEYYYREVEMSFKYQLIDSATNKILCYNKINLNESSGRRESSRELNNAYSMLEWDLKNTVSKIMKQIQPYVEVKSVKLLEPKGKNPEMKTAAQLAKESKLNDSYKAFVRIYDRTNLFEAGYNAALLQMVMGNLTMAENMMSSLYEETLDSRAYKALSDIRYEMEQAHILKNQTTEESLYL